MCLWVGSSVRRSIGSATRHSTVNPLAFRPDKESLLQLRFFVAFKTASSISAPPQMPQQPLPRHCHTTTALLLRHCYASATEPCFHVIMECGRRVITCHHSPSCPHTCMVTRGRIVGRRTRPLISRREIWSFLSAEASVSFRATRRKKKRYLGARF